MSFTLKEVEKLWQYQFGPWGNPLNPDSKLPWRGHPYTCPNRSDHPVLAGDRGVLVPTVRGWICPFCDYTQDWAFPGVER